MAQSARVILGAALSFMGLIGCATGEDTDTGNSFGSSLTPPGPATPAADPSMAETAGGSDDATTRPALTTEVFDPTTTTAGADGTTAALAESSGGDESTGPVVLCGNGAIDAPEECDGGDLNGSDCVTLGFSGGTLACTPTCIFDKIGCTSPSCGDGTVDPGEECDCGQMGGPCTMAQLGGSGCSSLASPNGGNYSAGELACNSPTSCSFNKAACTYCGDGVKNAAELCDAADLGGASCQSQGFAGGGLSCTGQCTYNTGGCTNCGNGIVDGGEQCDGGNFNGQSCQSINPNLYAGGSLSCSGGCDSIATGGCNAGNCCVAGGGPSACSVIPLRNCVCAFDPYCCNTNWDSACVSEVIANCGATC